MNWNFEAIEDDRNHLKLLLKSSIFSYLKMGATNEAMDLRFGDTEPSLLAEVIKELKAEGKIRDKVK